MDEDRYFRTLIDKHPDALLVVDHKAEVHFANPAAESRFGKAARDIMKERFGFPVKVGATTEIDIHPVDGNTIRAEMRVVETEWEGETAYLVSLHDVTKRAEVEHELRRRNGFIKTILDNLPIGIAVNSIDDGSARKQAEEQLLKLSRAVEQSPSAIIIYAMDGKVEYVNPKFTQMTGRRPEETLGVHVSSLGDLSPEENQRIWETILRGQEWHGEILNRKKNGETYWVSSSISPIREAGGTITHCVEIHEDITAQKLAAEKIRQQAEDLALLNAVNTAINRGASLPEVIQLLVEESKRIFSSYGVAVHLISQDKHHMILQNSPLPADTVERIEKLIGLEFPPVKIPLEAGSIFLEVLKSGKSRLINDRDYIQRLILEFTQGLSPSNKRSGKEVKQLAPKIQQLLSEAIHSVMIVPLLFGGEDIGLLGMYRQEPFTQADLRRFAAIAGGLTTAIQRATLHEQTERRLRRLNAMRNIDRAITASLDLQLVLNVLLDQVTSQLGVDAASVLLLEPSTQTLAYTAGRGFHTTDVQHTRLRLGEGYAGRAALERQLVSIPGLRAGEEDLPRSAYFVHEGFITYYCAPLIVKGKVNGVLEIFHRRLLTPDREWLDFLEALAGQAAIAIDEASLFAELQRSNDELALAYDSTLEGWVHALDLRDKETKGHTQRVTEMTLRLARAMGVNEEELVHVRRGALLHDIGKIGVPDRILHKPGPLDEDEWELTKKHPIFAHELLAPIDYLKPALDIPYCHHEKWDGTGYPRGLQGEQIPLAARIFAVADVWDALCSDRPYREAWSEEKALAYLYDQAGRHFDPQVVEVFLQLNGIEMNSVLDLA